MKTHLIQRGKFAKIESKKGIDSILSFDYMGSSESEWGALPKSLSEITLGSISSENIIAIKLEWLESYFEQVSS
jgi:hypothetical protein